MKIMHSAQDIILPVFININNTTHEILIRTLNDIEEPYFSSKVEIQVFQVLMSEIWCLVLKIVIFLFLANAPTLKCMVSPQALRYNKLNFWLVL